MDGSALYWACCFGHLRVAERAEALLDAGGTLVPDEHGEAMHIAANNSHTACCELLLDRGVDVHYCNCMEMRCTMPHKILCGFCRINDHRQTQCCGAQVS